MPELPEVETVRRGLQQQTTGLHIAAVVVHRARAIAAPPDATAFAKALQGSVVLGWSRRGKYLLASLARHPVDRSAPASGGHWGVHLRMTGQFLWINATDRGAKPPCSHTRVQIVAASGAELRFVDTRSFGQMWWVPPGQAPETVITGLTRLGPEPFNESFNAAYLEAKLSGSRRPIKNALLDQALVAGVGNIYADESLFAAGIRPHTPSGQLSAAQLETLHRSLVEVLEVSIGAGGTTFSDFRDLSGTNGNYGGVAWVYRRGGQPCRRCSTLIERTTLGGRSSHWCPTCQH